MGEEGKEAFKRACMGRKKRGRKTTHRNSLCGEKERQLTKAGWASGRRCRGFSGDSRTSQMARLC